MKQLILIFAFLFVATFAKSQSMFSSIKEEVKKSFKLTNVNISKVDPSIIDENAFLVETEYFNSTNYKDQLEEIKNDYKLYTIFHKFKYCTWYFDEKNYDNKKEYKMTIIFYNLK